MKIRKKAIKLLAGAIMAGFLSGSLISVPARAETTAAADSSISNSVLLNDLQCSPVDIDFSPDVRTYRIVVPEGTEKILVSAQLSDPSSLYRVIGNSNLQSGSNTVTVEVEDMDGNKNTYEIQVIVGELDEDETIEETESSEETTEQETDERTVQDGSEDSSSKGQSMAVISSQASVPPSSHTPSSSQSNILDSIKGFLTDQNNFKWILCGIGAVAVLLILLCIVLSLKKAKKKKQASPAASPKASSRSGDRSAPSISHDLSWTRSSEHETEEDPSLSDLFQSIKDDDPKDPASGGALDPIQPSGQAQDINGSEDDDDAFEIVDIDTVDIDK